jgi:hypothetical protein
VAPGAPGVSRRVLRDLRVMAVRGSQTSRLVDYVRDHPEATSLDITLACGIVNVTGRVSDARAEGVDIRCVRRSDNRQGYVVVEDVSVQLALAGFR